MRRDRGVQPHRGNRRAIQYGFKNYSLSVAAERLLAGGHFIEHNPKRKQIRAPVQFFSANLFRGHIGDRSQRHAGAREMIVLSGCSDRPRFRRRPGCASAFRQKFGKAKIQKLYLAAVRYENIRRLDVAVDDRFRVRRVKGVRHLEAILRDSLDLQWPPGNAVLERLPLKDLHNNEVLAFVLVHVVNCADVRMIQGAGGPRFALKAFDRMSVLGKLFREEFQGDVAAKFNIFRLVHHSHAASAQFVHDAVMGNGPPNHRKESAFGSSY